MVNKIYQFPNLSRIWLIVRKRRTSVEWTLWRHRNANNKVCPPPKFFSKLGPCCVLCQVNLTLFAFCFFFELSVFWNANARHWQALDFFKLQLVNVSRKINKSDWAFSLFFFYTKIILRKYFDQKHNTRVGGHATHNTRVGGHATHNMCVDEHATHNTCVGGHATHNACVGGHATHAHVPDFADLSVTE